jgi:hypothetical protein
MGNYAFYRSVRSIGQGQVGPSSAPARPDTRTRARRWLRRERALAPRRLPGRPLAPYNRRGGPGGGEGFPGQWPRGEADGDG